MSKSNRKVIVTEEENKDYPITIPIVIHNEDVKIKIYDPNDGGYFYRKIGFTTNFWDEE